MNDIFLGEDGFLEVGSALAYGALAAFCLYQAIRSSRMEVRLLAVWISMIATLCLARELDAHVILNPEVLGDFGMRYQLRWWKNGEISLLLKLGWLTALILAAWFLLMPPIRLRKDIRRVWSSGNAVRWCLISGIALLAVGFIVDDRMRTVHIISSDSKKYIEEAAEFAGAVLLLIGGALFLSAHARRFRTGFQA